jgi:hypothetical protein
MAGSTSFGWITPFDCSSFLVRFSVGSAGFAPGAIFSGTESTGGAPFGAAEGANCVVCAAALFASRMTAPIIDKHACLFITILFSLKTKHRSADGVPSAPGIEVGKNPRSGKHAIPADILVFDGERVQSAERPLAMPGT